VVAVDDERVDGDLRIAEHRRQRVQAQHGEPDRHLPGAATRGGVRTGQHGQDHPVPRVL
jgi:hypothetical protein